MPEQIFNSEIGAVLAIIATSGIIFAIAKLVLAVKGKNGNEKIDVVEIVKKTLELSSDNHLHEVPEILRSLQRIEESLNRNNEKLDKIQENILIIRSKI